jgi:hypothetical protein
VVPATISKCRFEKHAVAARFSGIAACHDIDQRRPRDKRSSVAAMRAAAVGD